MPRGFLIAILPALAACVGPQYDATPEVGDGAIDTDTEAGSDPIAYEGEQPCPDLAPSAKDVVAAREAFMEGVSAFGAGQYADAALAFCRAYAAHAAYQIWFNIARCEAELGNAGRAIAAYERFLAEGGEIPEESRQEVLDEIARLREASQTR